MAVDQSEEGVVQLQETVEEDVPEGVKKMEGYTEPKDAKEMVWRTSQPSAPPLSSSSDEEDGRYSKPYESPPGQNGTVPGRPPLGSQLSDDVYEMASAPPDTGVNYDVPPSRNDDYNHLSGSRPPAQSHSPNPAHRDGDSTYNHTLTWNSQKEEKRFSGGADSSPDMRKTSGENSPAFRRSGAMRRSSGSSVDEGRPIPNAKAAPALYEEAWDTTQKQKKLEQTLRLARTISSNSDKFEDAFEFLPEEPAPPPPCKPVTAGRHVNPVSGGDYEQAWDLNRGFEEKLRQAQLMHTGARDSGCIDAYQEPWDTPKKQKELEDKLRKVSTSGGGAVSPRPQRQQRGDIYEEAWDTKRNSLTHMLMAPRTDGGSSSQQSARSSQPILCSTVGEPVNAMIPLDSQDWYHGNISRDDAEKILRICKNGSYLVRDSSDGYHYTLSIKSPSMSIHIQIDHCLKSKNGSMGFVLGKNSKVFETIPAMIDYYTQHPVPIQGADHTILLYPVQCHWSKS